MVAVVSGSGLGLFNSSTSLLGGDGADGNSQVGRGRDRIYVNSSTGNLIVQGVDDVLSAIGLDFAAVRTYNSQGLTDEDNNDNWRLGVHQRIYNLTGTVNTAGSTVTKVFGDGSEVVYAWNATRSRYESTDGDGANDFLTWNAGNSRWTWTDGSARTTEEYGLINGVQRILISRDADANTITYTYAGSLLVSIAMAGATAQTVYLDYTDSGAAANNLRAIRVVSNGVTQTLTRYTYDSAQRLQTVTVDLTPANTSDAVTYVTTYTYDGSSKRIASITQSDGSSVAFTYQNINGNYRLRTVTDAENRVTTFTYSEVTGGGGTPVSLPANGSQISTTDTVDHPQIPGALTPSPAGWNEAALRERGTAGAVDSRIAFDSNGNGILVWRASTNVWAQRYTRATNSWGPEVLLDSRSTTTYLPAFSMDPGGNAVASWVQSDGNANSIWAARYTASTNTWTTAQLIDTVPTDLTLRANTATHTMVNVMNGTRAAIAFQISQVAGGSVYDLYVARFDGTNWLAPVLVEAGSADAGHPSIAMDSQGNIGVAFRQSDGTADSVFVNRFTASTGTWSGAVQRDTVATATAQDPRIAFDANGNGLLIYRSGNNINAQRYTRATNSWSAQVTLDTRTNTTYSPSLALDANGTGFAAWIQSNGTAQSVYAARFDGTAWSAPTLLDTAPTDPTYPVNTATHTLQLRVNGNRAAAIWQHRQGTSGSIYDAFVARYDGTTWLAPERVESRAENAAAPTLAIDGAGNISAAFQQSDGTAVSLYVSRYNVAAAPDFYVVPAGATWQSIAAAVYGIDSAAAGTALQAARAGQTLATGVQLGGFPPTLALATTVAPYYRVVAGDTWLTIAQKVYGTTDANAIAAMQAHAGTVTFSVGDRLPMQQTLNYTTGGSGPAVYQRTVVRDALGIDTTYVKDAQGRITAVTTPVSETRYTYDAVTGNVATVTEDPTGLNRVTTFGYDAQGNLTSTRDSLGNTVTRTYTANNQLETETSYLVRDPDGSGSGQPSSPMVSRFVYDATLNTRLRFTVSADGRVTEHVYDSAGQRTTTYRYAANTYSGAYTESALNTWAAGQRANALERLDYAYDFRGNVSTLTQWAATTSAGAGTGPASVTRFVYDQRGLLLSTVEARGEATSSPTTDYVTNYTYDGLGRRMVTTTWVSGTETARQIESTTYDDANRRTVSTFAGGLTKTLSYNRAGDLTSVVLGPTTPATTTYTYDANGRLRVTTDPVGVRTYSFYDDGGRLIGTVDGDGSLTELVYNRASQVVKTVRYATALTAATQTSLAGGSWSSVAFSALRTEANATSAANQITRKVYNNAGQLVYELDPLGGVTKYLYDGAGRVTDQIQYVNTQVVAASVDELALADITNAAHADDRRVRYLYNNDGQLTGTLDAAGFLKENVYDATGRLTAQIGYHNASDVGRRDAGTLDQLRPGSSGSVAQLDAARDITTRFFYDAQGRKVGELDGERYLTEVVYDVAGNVTQTIRYDRVLTFTPGTSTFATLKTAAAGAATQTTAYTYDGLGQVLTETNFQGTETLFAYDVAGNLIATTRANGVTAEARTTRARYDVFGRVTQELSGEGSVALAALGGSPTQAQIDDIWNRWGITHTYDTAGRRTSTTVRPNDSQTNTTYFYYDNDGRLRFTLDPRGRVSENRYNALGQLVDTIEYWRTVSISSPTGGLLTTTLISQLTGTEAANVHERKTFGYSLRGEVTSTSTVGGATTALGYNIFGELQSSNAGSGFHAYEYTYDARGLQKLTRRNGVTFEDRSYDAFGRLVSVIDGRGNTSTTQYDRLGRAVTSQQPGDVNARVTTYDGFSRVLTVRDKLLNTTSYGYNDSTRTLTITTPENIVVTTVYNRHGDTLTVTAAGNTTTYAYDRNGQLTSASDTLASLEGRSYDRAGRQITATDARGTITSFAYDAANRLLTRTEDSAAGGLQLVTTYAYDTQSRVLNVTEPGNRLTRTEYDRDGRVAAVIVDPNGSTPSRTEYVYDTANNVVTVIEGAGSTLPRRTRYVYDALGRRIEEIVDPISLGGTLNLRTQYKYDNNGNVTRKIDAANNSTWYTYDAQDRLVQTIDALGGVTGLSYDAEDRIIVTRRHFNTVSTGSLGDTPAIQSVQHHPNDRVTRSVYDRDGRERFTLQTLSATGTSGNITSETAIVTERTFDANGNVTRTRIYRTAVSVPGTLAPANVESALTSAGNSLSTVHADDRVEWTAYDLRGQVLFTVDGSGAVVRFTLDAAGNVVAQIEYATSIALSNLMTTASLTAWADQASVANSPRNRVTRTWYDTLDRARFSLDGEGYLVESRYLDSTRQEQQIVYAGKPTIAAGATLANVVSAASAAPDQANNQVTTQTLDVAGRVVQVNDANNRNEYFVYDAVGNKIRYVNQKAASASDAAYTWIYEYDANGRLVYERSPAVAVTTVTDSGATLTAATNNSLVLVTHNYYDALGNLTSRVEAEGTTQARTTSYEYDVLGRQTASVTPMVGIYDASLGDSELGNGAAVVRRETQDRVRSETAYDVFGNAYRNRLVTQSAASVAANGTYTYKAYDNLGRVKYEVDAKNQLTAYTYDAFGNKTQVTRYAAALSSSLSNTSAYLALSDVESRRVVTSSADRTIETDYDRLNRARVIRQPSADHFIPNVGSANGTSATLQPTVEHVYNAFGQVVMSRELIASGTWATSYFYYDRRGLKTAELDASRYLTQYFYEDSTGDLTRVIEYARPTTGAADVDSYGTIVTSAGGTAQGDDRRTDYVYDKLNRKISETRVNLEYSTISGGTLSTTFTGSQTTTYGYDVLGNQTLVRVQDPNSGANVDTYTYYDVLGRVIAVAEPQRDLGNNVSVIPLTRMLRDAHGNLVQKIEYASGTASIPANGSVATPSSPNATLDRTTTMLVDARNNVLRTEDATGADRLASYNTRGDVAKEWQVVVNPHISAATTDDITDTIVTLYRYDALGQQTQMVESQRYQGASTITATRIAEYNAFGEITAKYNQGDAVADRQYFHYDKLGRVWRTNSGDGVDKVYQYDLQGNATLELRSRTVDLGSSVFTAARDVVTGPNAVAAVNLMRTETVYDLRGNIVERRMPTYEISTGMPAVGTNLQMSVIGGNAWINWNGALTATVTETFEYRAAGSSSTWLPLNIEQVSAGVIGVNVTGTPGTLQEYRIRYMTGTTSAIIAESTGTFRVDRGIDTTFPSISVTPRDTSLDVAPVSIEQSGPINLVITGWSSQGWNGSSWMYDNILVVDLTAFAGLSATAYVTYTDFDPRDGTIRQNATEFLALDEQESLTQLKWRSDNERFGGMMSGLTASIQVFGPTGAVFARTNAAAGPPMLIWNGPPDTSVTATFKYKTTAQSTYSSVQATRFGPQFRIDVANLLTSTSVYDFEIEYVRNGEVVSRRGGQLNSTGVTTTRYPNGTLTDTTLNAWTQNITPPTVSGTTLQWTAPPSTFGTVTATFGIRAGQSGGYTPRTINPGPPYSVNLGDLPQNQPHEYEITYTLGGRVIAQQRGMVNLQFTAAATTTTVDNTAVDGAPAPISPVATVAGRNGVAAVTSATIAEPRPAWVTMMDSGYWMYHNDVDVTFPPIDSSLGTHFYVVVRHTHTSAWNYNQSLGTRSRPSPAVIVANTGQGGTRVSWDPPWQDPNSGRILNIVGVDVYACNASGGNAVLVRTTGGTGTAGRNSLVWQAPSQGGLTPRFFVNGSERSVSASGGNLVGDVGGLANGTYSYEVQYWRAGDPQPIVTTSGTFSVTGAVTAITGSQTHVSRNPAWIQISGNSHQISWSRVADQGGTPVFEYLSGGNWIAPTVNNAGDNTSFWVSVYGLATGTYNYRLRYASSPTGVLPYVLSSGSFHVSTDTTPNVTVLTNSAPHYNQNFGPARIQPVTLPANSEVVSWTYAKANAADSVRFFYTVGGTEHTVDLSAQSGPNYAVAMSALPLAANQSVTWRIEYRSGSLYPYAMANGSATITVTGTHQNPVVSVSNQALRYPSNVQQLAAPSDLGGGWFGWNSLSPETNATVTFLMNGSVAQLQPNGAQRRINYGALGAGTYTYELTFTRSGESDPYARVRGSFTVAKNPGAVTGTAFTVAPPRPESVFDIPPGLSTLDLVWPPQAVYWLYEFGQGGPRLQYGPRSYANGGGYEMLIPPGPEHPNGTWRRHDPPIYKFFGGQTTLTWARIGGQENVASVYYWSLSNPNDVKQMTVGAYENLWAAYPTDQNGNLINLADGNYGYRIEMRRTGAGLPWGVQTGTFVRSGGAYASVTATPNNTPVVQSVTPTSYQTFDRWGNVLETRDASSNVTNYRYNGRDQLVQTLEATDRMYRYSTDGLPTDVTGRAEKTNYYDALGRLIETQDGYDQATRVTYNAAGQQISKRNADHVRYAATSNNVYDIFGNLLQTTDEIGFRTRFKYDKAGRLIEVWREITAGAFAEASPTSTAGAIANLQVMYFRYDEAGRRISETNGIDTEITRYQYDHRGNVTARITPQQALYGLSTRYTYDINGKMITETDALGSVKSWSYNSFGRLLTHTELTNNNGFIASATGATITYNYNEAGQLSTQTSNRGQSIQYGYDAAGNLTSINDLAINRQTTYRYDAAGRRARETVFVDGRRHQDTRIGYDAHNRISSLDDPDYRQVIWYDANGNRSHIGVSYIDHNAQVISEELNYTYDEMNRVWTTTHWTILTQRNDRTTFTYNGRGDRMRIVTTETSMWERRTLGGNVTHNVKENLNTPVTEDYTYDGLGRLKTVTRDVEHVAWTANWQLISRSYVPTQIRSVTYDKAGRIDTDTTTSFEGGATAVNRVTSHQYDEDGRARVSTTRRGGNTESVTTFGRATLSGSTWSNGYDDAGNVRGYTVAYHNPDNGNHQYTATYKNSYELGENYRETQQSVVRSDNPNQPNYFYRGYNLNGELITTSASGDSSRNRFYTNNQNGQALTVINGNFAGLQLQQAWDAALVRGDYAGVANWAKPQHYFFVDGNMIGTFGQLQKAGSFSANFDVNYTPISDSYPGSVPSSIVAQAGDTLRTLAVKVFGDASLWYVIAEENGLTNPDEDLPDGMQLRIPNEVVSLANTSDSFKPYNPAEAMGDTTPTMPDPPAPKGGCGVIGMIIMIVVMVVVTIFTAGVAAGLMGTMAGSFSGIMAAGATALTATGAASLGFAVGAAVGAVSSVVTQGIGMALGIQDKFDWKQVAVGAISGGVGGGLARAGMVMKAGTTVGSKMLAAGVNAVVSNSLTQGVSVAVGLQKSFDWRSLAQSAVAAPLAAAAGDFIGSKVGPMPEKAGDYNFAKFASDATSTVVTAGVRSAMGGRFDVKQVTADVFGNAIGNAIVSASVNFLPKDVRNRTDAEKAAYRIGIQVASHADVVALLDDPIVSRQIHSRTAMDQYLREKGVTSFDQLSDEDQLGGINQVYRRGEVSIESVDAPSPPQSPPSSLRTRLGRGLAGVVVDATEGLGTLVEAVGEKRFKAGMFMISWALGGLPKAAVNFTVGEKVEEAKQHMLEPLKKDVSGFIGTYGFDAQNADEMQAVKPASDAVSGVTVSFAFSALLGGSFGALIGGIRSYRSNAAHAAEQKAALRMREMEMRQNLDAESAPPYSGMALDAYKLRDRITGMQKGHRPDPSTYMSKAEIDAHLSRFEGGTARLQAWDPTGKQLGNPDGLFVLPKDVVDKVLKDAGGDVHKMEDLLSIPRGSLGDKPFLVEIPITPGLRLSSGNELSANRDWVPGGFTKGGVPEAVIDSLPPGAFTVRPVGR